MTSITKGGNCPIPPGVTRTKLVLGWSSGPDLDASVLLLTGAGKVRSDADFVFYNQPASPEGSARHTGKQGTQDTLTVDLAALPAGIETVAIAASTDNVPFSAVGGLHLRVVDDATGTEVARFDVTSAGTETAFVLGELYLRNGAWKFRAVGQGWANGLAGLATDYGITVDDDPAPAAQPAPPPASQPMAPPPQMAPPPGSSPAGGPVNTTKAVRLEKQLQGQPPQMVNLVKQAGISLQKRGMDSEKARVALCLDISASMTGLYNSGKVQQLVERVLALAVQLDDDGQCDVFTFGTGGYTEGPVDLRNHQGWVQGLLGQRRLEGGTNYNKAIENVRRNYFPDGNAGKRHSPRPDRLPVYVMFVTDGHTTDENGTRNQVMWSSYEPIFWQFMAIGQSSRNVQPGQPKQLAPPPAAPQKKRGMFGGGGGRGSFLANLLSTDFKFLEELDDMDGRYLDNADFFSVADPSAIPDDQLFDLMMDEYPKWLVMARNAGLVGPPPV